MGGITHCCGKDVKTGTTTVPTVAAQKVNVDLVRRPPVQCTSLEPITTGTNVDGNNLGKEVRVKSAMEAASLLANAAVSLSLDGMADMEAGIGR